MLNVEVIAVKLSHGSKARNKAVLIAPLSKPFNSLVDSLGGRLCCRLIFYELTKNFPTMKGWGPGTLKSTSNNHQ
ncbi:Uncharacterized protein TCM_029069 [Theobroma cacao]|uniref:Uncharacterized protein n=1 Tax=Theobroma cacao TaxID=3641 RepID=A0A061GC50_THECC|nr:Uncharacterized protein TCM_029069 [Theobroma cacao]